MAVLAGLAAGVGSCRDNQDPSGVAAFRQRIDAANYRGWTRAPGYPTRQPSNGPHGGSVDIFVNDVAARVIAEGRATSEWPMGSLIVKDAYDGDRLRFVAAMEKRAEGWYWAEWSGSGEALYSGNPAICTNCHRSGSDMVRAFALPR